MTAKLAIPVGFLSQLIAFHASWTVTQKTAPVEAKEHFRAKWDAARLRRPKMQQNKDLERFSVSSETGMTLEKLDDSMETENALKRSQIGIIQKTIESYSCETGLLLSRRSQASPVR
jgi:hypothetical protein